MRDSPNCRHQQSIIFQSVNVSFAILKHKNFPFVVTNVEYLML